MRIIETNRVIRGGRAGGRLHQLVRPIRVPRGMTHREWAKREFERKIPVLRECKEPERIWCWILGVEELFQEVRPDERVKVTYAMFKLRGSAYGWWQSVVSELGHWRALDMSWDEFKARMMEAMGVSEFLSRIADEFYSFRMNGLTVDEYTAEYRRMLPSMRHEVLSCRDEVRCYARGLPEMYREYVGRQRCLDTAWLCALEIESHTVSNATKAEEAETQRHKSRMAGEPITDECPRCGQHSEVILDCDCLEMDCNRCGDWRHVATRCTAGVE